MENTDSVCSSVDVNLAGHFSELAPSDGGRGNGTEMSPWWKQHPQVPVREGEAFLWALAHGASVPSTSDL